MVRNKKRSKTQFQLQKLKYIHVKQQCTFARVFGNESIYIKHLAAYGRGEECGLKGLTRNINKKGTSVDNVL